MLVSPWHVLDRRHSQIFREQLLLNQRDKRGQVVGRGGGGQAGIKRVGSKAEEYNTNHHNPRQSSPRTGGISKPREEERERDVKLKNKTCFSF